MFHCPAAAFIHSVTSRPVTLAEVLKQLHTLKGIYGTQRWNALVPGDLKALICCVYVCVCVRHRGASLCNKPLHVFFTRRFEGQITDVSLVWALFTPQAR